MQAPNGVWVTPAFALSRSKLDELRPFPAAIAASQPPQATAQPPGAPPSQQASTAAGTRAEHSTGATASRDGLSSQPLQQAHHADTEQARVGPSTSVRPCKAAWFTHVVFDCDGVLVDSERASCEALRRAMLGVTGVHSLHVLFLAVSGVGMPKMYRY